MAGSHRKSLENKDRAYRGTHRRENRSRGLRIALAPWIVVSIIAGVLVSGVSVGYAIIVQSGCHGAPLRLQVTASPDQGTVVDQLAQQFAQKQVKVDGKCLAVNVEHRGSAEVVRALDAPKGWNASAYGPRPDVWMPDSSAWLRLAATAPHARSFVPLQGRSVAASPVVLAMPTPMHDALVKSWGKNKQLGWRELAERFATDASWGQFGHSEWGNFQFGVADPRSSTAGLHSVAAVADSNRDAAITDDEVTSELALERDHTSYRPDVDSFLEQLPANGAREPGGAALKDSPAFTALERDVALYNSAQPAVELTAVYPSESPAVADYPYVPLRAPWVDSEKRAAAQKFLTYLTSTAGQQAYGAAGFRDSAMSNNQAAVLRSDPNVSSHLPAGLSTTGMKGAALAYLEQRWGAARGDRVRQSE